LLGEARTVSIVRRSRLIASRISPALMMSGGTKRSVLRPAALMSRPSSSPGATNAAAAVRCS
jgi:hypothetical protein